MLHASIIWRKEWGWGDQAEQLLITEKNQLQQTQTIWTNLYLFIQSMHAWLTLFYAGQNLLNHLTAAFHPVHACLTHSILCRTEFAEPFDCSFSSSPCMLDSLYFMQDRICWTIWLQLFIQSMHAWLTLFYAGQNLLNQLTAAFHPVHACLTHSILCRTEFAEPIDCSFCASCCKPITETVGTVWPQVLAVRRNGLGFSLLSLGFSLLSSASPYHPSSLLPWWENCYHHPLTFCHDGETVIITL